jgi:hypothetical protein
MRENTGASVQEFVWQWQRRAGDAADRGGAGDRDMAAGTAGAWTPSVAGDYRAEPDGAGRPARTQGRGRTGSGVQ